MLAEEGVGFLHHGLPGLGGELFVQLGGSQGDSFGHVAGSGDAGTGRQHQRRPECVAFDLGEAFDLDTPADDGADHQD